MVTVSDIFSACACPLSFEIFPPKGDLTLGAARAVVAELAPLAPAFVRVTYSAGGSGNSRATAVVADVYKRQTLGGTGKETGKRHPTLGNNVLVGVGASVLGNITLGDNAKVGGGAVVVSDVPPNSTVVGIPGHIVVRDGQRVAADAQAAAKHQESLPDPMEEVCENLCERIRCV